ncbi:hypothetical protein JZ751_016370, partial [Albula glossodonta]
MRGGCRPGESRGCSPAAISRAYVQERLLYTTAKSNFMQKCLLSVAVFGCLWLSVRLTSLLSHGAAGEGWSDGGDRPPKSTDGEGADDPLWFPSN